jgi:hypothetical protein
LKIADNRLFVTHELHTGFAHVDLWVTEIDSISASSGCFPCGGMTPKQGAIENLRRNDDSEIGLFNEPLTKVKKTNAQKKICIVANKL